jgi:hypothetical protein
MDNLDSNDNTLPSSEFKNEIRNETEYLRTVPNKDREFKVMMRDEELRKDQNKNLEVNDWSMYDGQYPRLGPISISNEENTDADKNK